APAPDHRALAEAGVALARAGKKRPATPPGYRRPPQGRSVARARTPPRPSYALPSVCPAKKPPATAGSPPAAPGKERAREGGHALAVAGSCRAGDRRKRV